MEMTKQLPLIEISDEEEEDEVEALDVRKQKSKTRGMGNSEEDEEERVEKRGNNAAGAMVNEKEQKENDVPVPVGDVVRVSGNGRNKRKHYDAFKYCGNQFKLEDSVLLTGEDMTQKPYVVTIKEITEDTDGNVMINAQWFYRPEEAEKKRGGSWQSRDARELFYSFHLDEVPAEAVMYKCVVHFVPLNKQLPVRSRHPGFIVQRVYDTIEKKLWKLTEKHYQEHNQLEIELLIKKTRERIGELPEIEAEEPPANQLDQQHRTKVTKYFFSDVDVEKCNEPPTKSDEHLRPKTFGNASECFIILSNFKVLTGDSPRNKWLEKLLLGIRFICVTKDHSSREIKAGSSDDSSKSSKFVHCSPDKNCNKTFYWPDDAIPAITSLEKAVYDTLGIDFTKYNQKMRQLDFNLKNNQLLARRLLNKELEPSVILNMSPAELKDALTAEEKPTQEPYSVECTQMTDALCSRCAEKKVRVADVFHAGRSGDRYQLECIACGHSWYDSRNAISSFKLETVSVQNIGTT